MACPEENQKGGGPVAHQPSQLSVSKPLLPSTCFPIPWQSQPVCSSSKQGLSVPVGQWVPTACQAAQQRDCVGKKPPNLPLEPPRAPMNSRSCTWERCWKSHFEAKGAGHQPAPLSAMENNRPNPMQPNATQRNPTQEGFKIHP